ADGDDARRQDEVVQNLPLDANGAHVHLILAKVDDVGVVRGLGEAGGIKPPAVRIRRALRNTQATVADVRDAVLQVDPAVANGNRALERVVVRFVGEV